MKRIFVQIGVHTHLGYDYVVGNSQQIMKFNILNRHYGNDSLLPFELLQQPFDAIVGVDMNPKFIEEIKLNYQDSSKIYFLNRVVWDKNVEALEHRAYNLKLEEHPSLDDGSIFETRCVTLNKLFSEIKEIEGLENGRIYGLAMDVEGVEDEILKGCNWENFEKPDFIKVETHTMRTNTKVLKTLLDQGYHLLEQFRAFADKTMQLYFLHESTIGHSRKMYYKTHWFEGD